MLALSAIAGATTTYSDYLIWGENGVQVGHDSVVNGLVGARNNRTAMPSPHESVNLTGGAKVFGTVRAGADVAMANSTHIDTLLYEGTLSKQSSATVTSENHVADADLPTGPIPSQWPGAAAHCAVNHTPDINNANGTTINLTPGVWGTVHAGSNTTLNLNGAGDYLIDELDTGRVTFNYPSGVRLFVCTKFALGNIVNTAGGAIPANSIYTEVFGFGDDGHGFEVDNGQWHGDIVVPTGGVHYGSGGSGNAGIKGHVWAENVDLEHAVQVTIPTTTTTTTSTTAPTTTTTTVPETTTTTTVPQTTTTSTIVQQGTSTTSTTVADTTTSTVVAEGSSTTTSIGTTGTTVPKGPSNLPFTGTKGGLIPPALILLGAGLGLMAGARRRRSLMR
jgi:hypothetical protein